MIITVSGTITDKGENYAVVEAAGIGYQVFMHAPALSRIAKGAKVRLWSHEHLREDARELYGFVTKPEHALFKKLLGISGIGPRAALSILSLGEVAEVEKMIRKADVAWLSRVPGVGKKTAQKIVLELQGKLVDTDGVADEDEEVVSALVNLGYTREKAREALRRVPATEGAGVEDRLRTALRAMTK